MPFGKLSKASTTHAHFCEQRHRIPAYILMQSFLMRMQHDREKQCMQETEETVKLLSDTYL